MVNRKVSATKNVEHEKSEDVYRFSNGLWNKVTIVMEVIYYLNLNLFVSFN